MTGDAAGRDGLVMAKPAGPACNLRCDYCYYLGKERLFPAGAARRMSDDLLERYVAGRLRSAAGPSVHFEWHGGEATLLGLDYFRRIAGLQRRHAVPGLAVTNGLQTNGLLLDAAWADFLAAERWSVGLSLDGPADLHDAHRRTAGGRPTHREVERAFRLLARRRVQTDVLAVLHAGNAPAPERVYRYFRELGVRRLQLLPLVEPEAGAARGVSARTAPAELLGEFLCAVFDAWIAADLGRVAIGLFDEALRPAMGLGHALCVFRETCGDVVVLEHDGGLYACDHFVDPAHRIGDLRERPLEALFEDPALVAFGARKRGALADACRECDVLAWCNGGCPKDRIAGEGAQGAQGAAEGAVEPTGPEGAPRDPPSYLCPAYRRFFRHARPIMERLALHLRTGRPVASFAAAPRAASPGRLVGAVIGAASKAAGGGRSARIGPNAPCPCGSGRKYKRCCGA